MAEEDYEDDEDDEPPHHRSDFSGIFGICGVVFGIVLGAISPGIHMYCIWLAIIALVLGADGLEKEGKNQQVIIGIVSALVEIGLSAVVMIPLLFSWLFST
jgi:hypothetical protein